jgi:hypothetical protein
MIEVIRFIVLKLFQIFITRSRLKTSNDVYT